MTALDPSPSPAQQARHALLRSALSTCSAAALPADPARLWALLDEVGTSCAEALVDRLLAPAAESDARGAETYDDKGVWWFGQNPARDRDLDPQGRAMLARRAAVEAVHGPQVWAVVDAVGLWFAEKGEGQGRQRRAVSTRLFLDVAALVGWGAAVQVALVRRVRDRLECGAPALWSTEAMVALAEAALQDLRGDAEVEAGLLDAVRAWARLGSPAVEAWRSSGLGLQLLAELARRNSVADSVADRKLCRTETVVARCLAEDPLATFGEQMSLAALEAMVALAGRRAGSSHPDAFPSPREEREPLHREASLVAERVASLVRRRLEAGQVVPPQVFTSLAWAATGATKRWALEKWLGLDHPVSRRREVARVRRTLEFEAMSAVELRAALATRAGREAGEVAWAIGASRCAALLADPDLSQPAWLALADVLGSDWALQIASTPERRAWARAAVPSLTLFSDLVEVYGSREAAVAAVRGTPWGVASRGVTELLASAPLGEVVAALRVVAARDVKVEPYLPGVAARVGAPVLVSLPSEFVSRWAQADQEVWEVLGAGLADELVQECPEQLEYFLDQATSDSGPMGEVFEMLQAVRV